MSTVTVKIWVIQARVSVSVRVGVTGRVKVSKLDVPREYNAGGVTTVLP